MPRYVKGVVMIIGMVRYAIPNSFMNTNNSRSLVQLYEEPYFSDRFNIFCNITLKSFAAQTNQNFVLCVYHTNLIPDDKKVLFDNLAKQYLFLRNVYTDGAMFIPDDLKEPTMLTFRIDNDDGMAIDFIEKMQQIKDSYNGKSTNFAISLPHMRKIGRISENQYKTIATDFVSNSMGLAYLGSDGRTVMNLGNHRLVPYSTPMLLVEGNGGLQVINGYNVANGFNKRYQNQTEDVILDKNSMEKFLYDDGYANIDLSCLPIIKQ